MWFPSLGHFPCRPPPARFSASAATVISKLVAYGLHTQKVQQYGQILPEFTMSDMSYAKEHTGKISKLRGFGQYNVQFFI